MERFKWTSIDLRAELPPDWQATLVEAGQRRADRRTLLPRHASCREGDNDLGVVVATVDAAEVRHSLQWLYKAYHGMLREIVEQVEGQPITTAVDDRHGVVLNVLLGTDMRYEAHLDTNPIEGILFGTTHPPGTGGELVFASHPEADGVVEIDEACTCIYPVAGHLILFDGRRHPHYVRPLRDDGALRVVAAMNFYTAACPETARPQDLDGHLAGY